MHNENNIMNNVENKFNIKYFLNFNSVKFLF